MSLIKSIFASYGSHILGGILFLVSLSVTESVIRQMSADIAKGADFLLTASSYIAKWQSSGKLETNRIVILGDSVALGDTLRLHGDANWRQHNLGAALHEAMAKRGRDAPISNFAGNGLRPADIEATFRDLVANGTRRFVIVMGLRGFSADFETAPNQYEHPWRRKVSLSCGSWLCKSPDGKIHLLTQTSAMLSRLWITRGAIELWIGRFVGSLPKDLVTRFRTLGQTSSVDDDLMLTFQANRRYQSVAVEDFRIQTQALRALLTHASEQKVSVVLAYATENPRYQESLGSADIINQARKALASLAAQHPQTVIWLGPDEEVTNTEYLDFIHPNRTGYQRLAERIADVIQKY